MHGAERGQLFVASGTGCHVRLDVAGVPGIELAVDQRMQHDFRFIAFHDAVPEATAGPRRLVEISAAFHAARSMARARASRDMTVPTGTPATWAISWYDRLFISRSTIASRNGSGKPATSRLIVAVSCWRTIIFSGEGSGSCHIGISSAGDSSEL